MRLLLDTHTVLWALWDPARLPDRLLSDLLDPANEVLVSVASLWEIAIKQSLGKLYVPSDLNQTILDSGFEFHAIRPQHCAHYAELPGDSRHRDPFDRMLVVQATAAAARLVSRDTALDRYDVDRYWPAGKSGPE